MLEQLVARVPPPAGDPDAPPRALIFDSEFDQYRGVIAYIRVVDGVFRKGEAIRAMAAGTEADIDDIGFFTPAMTPAEQLARGRGRLPHHRHQGRHEAARRRHADDASASGATEPLPGYREVKPMVFCGLFPIDSDDYPDLRDALEKLTLNDAALTWEPETSDALGFGFRCGFLGLLHMDIVRERLEREYDLELHGDDAIGGLRGHADQRRRDRGPQPDRHARPGADRGDPRAVHQRVDPRAEGVHRRRSWSSARSAAASTRGCTT